MMSVRDYKMIIDMLLSCLLRLSRPDTRCSSGEPPIQKEVRAPDSAHLPTSFITSNCFSHRQCHCVISSISVHRPHNVTVLSHVAHFSRDRLCFESGPVLIVISLCQTITARYNFCIWIHKRHRSLTQGFLQQAP